jgi:hypothetical protein
LYASGTVGKKARSQKPEARRKGEARRRRPEARRKIKGNTRASGKHHDGLLRSKALVKLPLEWALDVVFDLSSGFWLSFSAFAFSSGFWLLASGLPVLWLSLSEFPPSAARLCPPGTYGGFFGG